MKKVEILDQTSEIAIILGIHNNIFFSNRRDRYRIYVQFSGLAAYNMPYVTNMEYVLSSFCACPSIHIGILQVPSLPSMIRHSYASI